MTPFILQQAAAIVDKSGEIDVAPAALMERIDNMIDAAIQRIPNIAIAIIVFFLILIAGKVIQKILVRTFRKDTYANIGIVLARLTRWVTLIVGIMFATMIIVPSVGPGDLLASLGIGGVAIGFAFKDILQNFLAGILLLIRQPFRIGDTIEFGDFYGVVQEIETRTTIIKTLDGRQILIPNGEIYTNPVTVYTAYDQVRSQYDVGIGYGDNIALASEKIIEAVLKVEGVSHTPTPESLIVALSDSTVNLRIRWWTDSRKGVAIRIQSAVLQTIKDTLDAEGIDMPFPTQVMLFHDQTEETDGDRTQQREGWPAGQNPPRAARLIDRNAKTSDARASV